MYKYIDESNEYNFNTGFSKFKYVRNVFLFSILYGRKQKKYLNGTWPVLQLLNYCSLFQNNVLCVLYIMKKCDKWTFVKHFSY